MGWTGLHMELDITSVYRWGINSYEDFNNYAYVQFREIYRAYDSSIKGP